VIIPEEKEKFLNRWRYVEVARYVPDLSRVIRMKENDNPVMIDIKDIDNFREQWGNTGLYTSIWHYDSKDIDNAVRLGPLYFDIDSSDSSESLRDARSLVSYLLKYIPENCIVIYFTGKKGFHVECEPQCLGINPSNNLPNIFRWIANNLKEELSLNNLDFSVYDSRRMWRLPFSKHQDTGLYKNSISADMLNGSYEDIVEHCRGQKSFCQDYPVFNAKANEWYRNNIYEAEIDKERSKDFLVYFNRHGSEAFKEFKEVGKEFTPKRLLENCSAVKRLWQQAIDTKFLEHEARLFLCSVLSYNEDSIKFLHGILSNCDDYNYEKSMSHINDWIKRRQLGIGGRPYTCERANSAGVGCGDCSLEKRNKWIKVGDRYIETDEVSSPSPIRFAYVSVSKGGESYGNSK